MKGAIMSDVVEGLKKLRQPFPNESINLLPKPYKKDSPKGKCPECGGYHGLPAVHLAYVGHAALTDRLLSVDPLWSWEPMALDATGLPLIDGIGGLWIRLTILGVTRLGYGHALGSTGDAMKERIGDALRNAAMRFGAALELWHKGKLPPMEEDSHGDDSEPAPTISEEQTLELVRLIKQTETDTAKFLEYLKINALDELPANQFKAAKAMLEKKKAKMAKSQRQPGEEG
jgi:hypothetical protein